MRRPKSATALLLGVLVLGAGAGCGSSPRSAPTSTATPATTTTAIAAASYPVTVTAANGAITIPARPTRILSLSATATEMLYSIGAGSQVAGVDKYSTDPAGAPRTVFDGNEGAESYVPLHPDLVIVAFDTSGKLVGQLGVLHIPVLVLPPATTIADTYSQFRVLGVATGHGVEATREATTISQQLDSITRAVGDRAKGRTYYHEVDSTLYTATSKTFIGALYARLGMVNVADAADHTGSGYPQLSAEYLVKANPDYVFLADTVCCHESAATFAARPGFSVMSAVHLGRVIGLPDPIASQWGPRVVDLLQDIANAVAHATTPATTG
jgi:iron complex transport system substrate-binding protein